VNETDQLVIVGGSDGIAGVYSIPENKLQQSFKAGGAVTDATWYGKQPVVSTASGAVKVFGNSEMTFSSHAGSANALAVHPSGDILASVGVDKSFVFYDLPDGKAVSQIYTDSGMSLKQTYISTQFLTCIQSLVPPPFIPMDISLLLEVWMGKLNFFTSSRAKVQRILSWEDRFKILPSLRTVSGLQLLPNLLPVL
jgi:hypothetical protein